MRCPYCNRSLYFSKVDHRESDCFWQTRRREVEPQHEAQKSAEGYGPLRNYCRVYDFSGGRNEGDVPLSENCGQEGLK